jgi:hypothetical protein
MSESARRVEPFQSPRRKARLTPENIPTQAKGRLEWATRPQISRGAGSSNPTSQKTRDVGHPVPRPSGVKRKVSLDFARDDRVEGVESGGPALRLKIGSLSVGL